MQGEKKKRRNLSLNGFSNDQSKNAFQKQKSTKLLVKFVEPKYNQYLIRQGLIYNARTPDSAPSDFCVSVRAYGGELDRH
ncbi:predicted protein [Sclerotinia sclerotiorum 1980 UF-70]|uniref:Uncharacterized protein n=1 Tax=Sclerotinia sclerotiorum (strain ATCC 18683 / 1980 / Ss-1) TaxID=665079 RepID=A7EJU9_SCLS1|nr:predicted protein [Sclerotinia sclerotiorum 1980 UF-70]EDO03115.1 predicted protein [Sclerotinia sclerotiorum 1980 UF-70]